MIRTLFYAMFALAVVLVARADATTSFVNVSVANTLGVQRIESSREYTPLAVCFGETGVAANLPVNLVRQATNLVFTASLEPGDSLHVYDHARGGYVSYRLVQDASGVKTWSPQTTYSATGTDDLAPLPDQSQAWGYGFWLHRPGIATRANKTISISGQVPVGQVTVTLAPTVGKVLGKTLVGNPIGVAWDLNDPSVYDWSKAGLEKNVHVQLSDWEDGSVKFFYWMNNKWVCRSAGHLKDPALIPAGAAFWFVRGATGTNEITIEFTTGL